MHVGSNFAKETGMEWWTNSLLDGIGLMFSNLHSKVQRVLENYKITQSKRKRLFIFEEQKYEFVELLAHTFAQFWQQGS